eukprot:Clim_evm1s11 gene=Clim_evmTU1s11
MSDPYNQPPAPGWNVGGQSNENPGYPPHQPGYPPQQGYPPHQGYPPQQGYPPHPPGYQQPGYPSHAPPPPPQEPAYGGASSPLPPAEPPRPHSPYELYAPAGGSPERRPSGDTYLSPDATGGPFSPAEELSSVPLRQSSLKQQEVLQTMEDIDSDTASVNSDQFKDETGRRLQSRYQEGEPGYLSPNQYWSHKYDPLDSRSYDVREDGPEIFNHMPDGSRIDYVLMWHRKKKDKLAKIRRRFEERLIKGQKAYIHRELDRDGRWMYVKIHFPFEALAMEAERIELKKPIHNVDDDLGKKDLDELPGFFGASRRLYRKTADQMFELAVKLRITRRLEEQDGVYSAKFRRDRLDDFVGSEDKDAFFTYAQRSLLAYNILDSKRWGPQSNHISIQGLLGFGIYTSAFPLHEGSVGKEHGLDEEHSKSDRRMLYDAWASYKNLFRMQPHWEIREYFGSRTAFYFAWIGFYTGWLAFASILALIVTVYGISQVDNSAITDQICASDLLLCPQVEGGDFITLSDAECKGSKLSTFNDNASSAAVGLFAAIWAVAFLEFWKRKQNQLGYEWDVLETHSRDRERPAFQSTHEEVDPVTGKNRPVLSWPQRMLKVSGSLVVGIIFVGIVVLYLVLNAAMRAAIYGSLYDESADDSSLAAGIISAVISLLFILIMERVVAYFALILTEYENWRLQSDYDRSLVMKLFIFYFVVNYAPILYVALILGNLSNRPGSEAEIFGLRIGGCGSYGCMFETYVTMLIIFGGKVFVGNIIEVGLPYLARVKAEKIEKMKGGSPWERDAVLAPASTVQGEYLEIMIQFGYAILFAAAFPLGAILGLVNNIFEIRIDAQKFLVTTKRAPPLRASGIGTWYPVLAVMSRLAVISNALIVAFTSEYTSSRFYYHWNDDSYDGYLNVKYALATPAEFPVSQDCYYESYKDANERFFWQLRITQVAAILIIEHVIFGLLALIDFFIPDVPRRVQVKIAREKFLATKVLEQVHLQNKMAGNGNEKANDQIKEQAALKKDI